MIPTLVLIIIEGNLRFMPNEKFALKEVPMVHETFPNILYALLLQDFPESVAVTMAVFSLINFRLWDRRLLWVALLLTFTNLVRLLPIAFGMHSVILIIGSAILTCIFTKAKLSKIFLAVLVCYAVIATSELIYVKPLLNMTGLSYDTVFHNPFLRSAFALPDLIILLVIAFGKNYYNQKKGLIISC